MAEEPDIDKLAKQYLDLWQDHLKTMSADPQVAETMSQMTQMMTGSATAFAAMAGQAMAAQEATGATNKQTTQTTDGQNDDDTSKNPLAADTVNASAAARHGTTSDADAHGSANIDLAEFARRLDGIERRLAALEAGTGGAGGRSGKGARRRKS